MRGAGAGSRSINVKWTKDKLSDDIMVDCTWRVNIMSEMTEIPFAWPGTDFVTCLGHGFFHIISWIGLFRCPQTAQ